MRLELEFKGLEPHEGGVREVYSQGPPHLRESQGIRADTV